jgi:hypothetical protein
MKDKLTEVTEELSEYLGYTDIRSIKAWCKQNKVPIFKLGKKRYTIRNFVDYFIEKELSQFAHANFSDAEGLLEAIQNDDKIEFARLFEAPVSETEKRRFIKKKARSKASEAFLNKLKSA